MLLAAGVGGFAGGVRPVSVGYQPTTKRIADQDGPDFYPTPAWATYGLLAVEQFTGAIWEPACGDGAMAEVLRTTGCEIFASDLYDRGYASGGYDFLAATVQAENVVTNPPFHSAEAFIHQALRCATRKVALLLRLQFLECSGRAERLFEVQPPARVWVFSERITFYSTGAVRAGSGTTAYAWYVWDPDHQGPPQLGWIPRGLKARYGAKKSTDAGSPVLTGWNEAEEE